MSHSENTSGVDRYIGMLLKGLEIYPNIRVHWIHLVHDITILFHSEQKFEYYTKITIPLPQQFGGLVSHKFWINKYNEHVYRLIGHLFEGKSNCILHIHTLNLIDLAILIRSKIQCKIITHLHCIPWKGLYNSNVTKFNELYNIVYKTPELILDRNRFVTNYCEISSYSESDHIICVTNCAVDFLTNIMHIPKHKISVICNGINDYGKKINRNTEFNNREFKLLYVGVLSQSKGLKYIFEAMREVQRKGFFVSLTIAGKIQSSGVREIKQTNKDLTLNMVGCISFHELIKYYRRCDAGIIASLQEQSSYVAIEMAMFGLPIITTAVDGLDEMFTDNVNALKVNTRFSLFFGLTADVDTIADKIIILIENRQLRLLLGKNVRYLYESDFTLKRMIQQTVAVYHEVSGGEDYV